MNPLKINLESPSEIVDLLNNPKHREHVLEREKGHSVSFSLREKVACQYATTDTTHGRKKSGYIAMVKFPDSTPITYCSQGPYMYKGSDGTLLIDLRRFPVQGDAREWNRVRQRTVGDYELLLVRAVLRPFNIITVSPNN